MATDGTAPDPATLLRARNLRATPQRQAILETFEGGPAEHLSAEEIHARAVARVKGLGRGTVYATLAELAERGLLGAVGDQEPIRYEVNTAPHQHFHCRVCMRIIDVDFDPPPEAALSDAGFAVETIRVVADGVCGDCGEYARGLGDGATAMRDALQVGDTVMNAVACVRHESALGPMLAAASGDGIARIAFPGQADFEALDDRARTRRGGRAGRDRAGDLLDAVDAYLAGNREPLTDGIDWRLVGGVGRATMEAAQQVAWGDRRSYLDICEGGYGPYECGYRIGSNPLPILVPCHRISRGQEVMSDWTGGGAIREQLDALESAG